MARPEAAEHTRQRDFYERYQRLSEPATRGERSEHAYLRAFVEQFRLAASGTRVLEVGSSHADFRRLVPGWVGIDLALAAGRGCGGSFAVASAERLPFSDASFDGLWSIAVLEHVPRPQSALDEILRVLKPGGAALLAPAWHCRPWAAQGLHVRPYRELGWRQRLVKLTIPVRNSLAYRALWALPGRCAREMGRLLAPRRPTALRYRRLRPNYETFWAADSDACSSLDPHETLAYFQSRGCAAPWHRGWRRLAVRHGPIVVVKP